MIMKWMEIELTLSFINLWLICFSITYTAVM